MAKKPTRARTDRRAAERDALKLTQARLKLAALEPGGSPDRPIEVTSASVVEPHAASIPCAACGQNTRIEEHEAITVTDDRGAPRHLRVARVRCARCGTRRDVFFRLGTPLAN